MSRYSALKKVLGDQWEKLGVGGQLAAKIGAGSVATGAAAGGMNILNDELSGKNAAQRAVLRKISELGEAPEETLEKLKKFGGMF